MNRLRRKLVTLLTALAFLSPQIAGATKFELVEVHETAGVSGTQRGTLVPVMKMHAVLDKEIYSSKSSNSSDPNDTTPGPATGHRHCSFSLAGCMTLMDASDRVSFVPAHSYKAKPSQQSFAGITPDFVLPPPKCCISGAA